MAGNGSNNEKSRCSPYKKGGNKKRGSVEKRGGGTHTHRTVIGEIGKNKNGAIKGQNQGRGEKSSWRKDVGQIEKEGY